MVPTFLNNNNNNNNNNIIVIILIIVKFNLFLVGTTEC
jgi:hypothetical protein